MKQKSADYFFNSEVNTSLVFDIPHIEKPNIKKRKNIIRLEQKQLPEKIFLSKNESLNALPSTDTQQQYTSLSKNCKFSRRLTNMELNTKTEVNNDIYYFIWNCESTSKHTLERYRESALNHSSSIIRDDQYWVSAHEDFTSAGELMNVFDETPQLFLNDDKQGKICYESRSYSDVLILYTENPLYNKIIYGPSKIVVNTNKHNDKKNCLQNSQNLLNLTPKELKKTLNFELLQDSVKEFIMTIRDIEDEDELTISSIEPHVEIGLNTHEDELDGNKSPTKKSRDISVQFTKNLEKSDENYGDTFQKKGKIKKLSRNEPVIKMRSKEQADKLKNRQRRRSMGEETKPLFTQPVQNTLRNAKSTSNLLESDYDEQIKAPSNFMSKFKKFFKKREVSLGPGPSENKIFGNSIQNLDMSSQYENVPLFVVKCITELETDDFITTHGLYRASGNKTTIDEIKKKIDESGSKSDKRYECLKDQEPNTLAGLLKQFFRELESGLISYEIAKQCIKHPLDKLELRKLVSTLEGSQKATLKYLIKHLTRVNEKRSENKMDSNNLSIVWGPCLFKSMHSFESIQTGVIGHINLVVKTFIDNYNEIFEK